MLHVRPNGNPQTKVCATETYRFGIGFLGSGSAAFAVM